MTRKSKHARPTFVAACAQYVHRYTLEHVPSWARAAMSNTGESLQYYAPQYRSDREWYEHTLFPGESGYPFGTRQTSCYTTGQTWPLGKTLAALYVVGGRS